MKESNFTFSDGFLGVNAKKAAEENKPVLTFDWDKAAKIIKTHFKEHKDLIAEAGLQEDWEYTGGIIFEDGKPTNDSYTYLSSNWAIPTLILSWDGLEQEEIECFTKLSKRFNKDSKWDDESLKILGIKLKE